MRSEILPPLTQGSPVGARLLDCYAHELHLWLSATAGQLLAVRNFSFLARERVALDIEADITRSAHEFAAATCAAGHRSEIYDLEAEKILEHVLAAHPDLTAEERRELSRAKALVHRSAEADHEITELAAVPA